MKDKEIQEKGITLIALVVTIILLLILAGVTISQIAGSNGLFQRARQAAEKYKNSAEEEQIQIGMLEQYVSDFSVIGGDEGEDKASVTIKEFTVSGDTKNRKITVKVTVKGESTGIEYKINSEENWTERKTDGTVKEGTEGEEKETEYTYTFENLALGKGYYVRVKAYDTEGKYVEVTSDVVTLSNVMTAKEEDVLKDKTYLAEDGSVKTGTMPNNGAINEITLSAGQSKDIPLGYTSGGKITAQDLASQTPGTATTAQILSGQKAWVDGRQLTGTMQDKTNEVNELKKQLENTKNELASKKSLTLVQDNIVSDVDRTIDCTKISGYNTLTANNFLVVVTGVGSTWHASIQSSGGLVKTYNGQTGQLTVTKCCTITITNNIHMSTSLIYSVYCY